MDAPSTEEFAEVCSQIVEDLYGSFLAQIFRHLTRHGRLTAHQLAQRCHLPLRQIKSGLAALTQQRLIYHHTSREGQSTYSPNVNNAYCQLRFGRLIELVRARHGSASSKIIEILSTLGFATVYELESQFHTEYSTRAILPLEHLSNGGRRNLGDLGTGFGRPDDLEFRNALKILVEESLIVAVTEAQLHPAFDVRDDLERTRRQAGISTSKTKRAQVAEDVITSKGLEEARDAHIDWKVILRELQTNDEHDSTYVSTILRVDLSRLRCEIRCEKVATIAEKTGGSSAGRIAREICGQVHLALGLLDPLSISNADRLQQPLDLGKFQESFRKSSSKIFEQSDGSFRTNGKHGPEDLANGDSNLMDRNEVARQLTLLADGPLSFLSGSEDTHTWMVDVQKLAVFLRDHELLRLLEERVTGPSLRIVRMLADKGKLDEKCLQEIGLLGAKELRQCLAQMQSMGFLELQEVPREAQRQPNRTIFLWFYDPERVRNIMLSKLYKTISRLFQRLQLERAKLISTLSKIERSDVRGSEQEMLSAAELQVLDRWRRKELWLMAEIYRIDNSVAILETS